MITGTSAMDKAVAAPRGRLRKRTLLLAAAGVLLLGLGLATPLLRRWAATDRSIEGSRLRFATIVRGDLERDVAAQGRIVAALHPTLFSPAQGIVALATKAGSVVKKGQALARIESPELVSRFNQERSTTQSLEADLGRQEIATRQAVLRSRQSIEVLTMRRNAARRARERAQELFAQGLLNKVDEERSEDDLQTAELELKNARETAELEKETLEFELRNRRLAVERQASVARELERQVALLDVKAPFDGMVATVGVQDRDAVAPNQAVLTIVDLSAFEVEFDVPENYAALLTAGTRAEILYEGRPYPGTVTVVSPEVRDSQVRGTVMFDGATPPGLRQSQRVSVRMVLEHRNGVLKAARGPFLESGGGRSVYVVEGDIATRREVEVGAVSVAEVEIVRGLEEGQRIVVSDTSVFEGATKVLIR